MRSFLALWGILSLAVGGLVVWFIIASDMGATAAGLTAGGYVLAGAIASWFIAPLAPPRRK